MSLAATLAAQGVRPVSFLPTIKCSSCGDEIEIAAMGDHLCGKAPPSPKAMPASMTNPFTLRQMNASGALPSPTLPPQPSRSAPPQTRVRAPTLGSGSNDTPGRRAPPRISPINPEAANRPFLAPQQSRSQAPLSPAISVRSGSSQGKPTMSRNMTSPLPRLFDVRPPSPELSGGYDCAFPPFPTFSNSTGSRPGTSNGRKTPSNDRAPSRGAFRQDSRFAGEREGFGFEPRSPMVSADNVMSKMNTLKSGPFDASRRKPSREERLPQLPLQDSQTRRPSVASNGAREQSPQRPTTAGSGQTQPDGSRKGPPARPTRPQEEIMSPTFLDKLSQEPATALPSKFPPSQAPVLLRNTDRSNTFPIRQQSTDEPGPAASLSRTPSEPALRGRERRPTITASSHSAPGQVPQMMDLPPRSQSRNGTRMDYRMQDAPPVPKPVQQHKQESKHTPSESSSSVASSARSYSNSNSTSGPSPIGSAASSVDAFLPLSQTPTLYGEDEKMRVARLNVRNPERPGMRAEQPAERSPPRNTSGSRTRQNSPVPETPPNVPISMAPLESPMDPAMNGRKPFWGEPRQSPPQQNAMLSLAAVTSNPMSMPGPAVPVALAAPADAPRQVSLHAPTESMDDYDPYKPLSPRPGMTFASQSNSPNPESETLNSQTPTPRARSPAPLQPPPIPQETPRSRSRPPPQRRQTTGVKSICRGCNKMIEGKSVKAADGRLTGRWHKQCFTCRTCSQPFATADFYVIDNNPYCEQHYHEANGSLCHGCHLGIEGQYLETSSISGNVDRKYHPRCFTCIDCRVPLTEDYFEISGRNYCERHALQAMRGQARMAGGPAAGAGGSGGLSAPDKKGLMAERRSTRLMMM